MKAQKTDHKELWMMLGILVVLAPLGLILPELLRASGAWGEWGADEIEDIVGYVPEGLKHISELWTAPIPDYAFTGWDKGIKSYLSYIASGLIGTGVVVAISLILGKILRGRTHIDLS